MIEANEKKEIVIFKTKVSISKNDKEAKNNFNLIMDGHNIIIIIIIVIIDGQICND